MRETFMSEYQTGKLPSQILIKMEIDPHLLGKRRIDSIVHLSKQYELRPKGCKDTRRSKSNRPTAGVFFGHMKDEIDNYMDYYNNDRDQWRLAKLSPNQYA